MTIDRESSFRSYTNSMPVNLRRARRPVGEGSASGRDNRPLAK